MNRVFEITLQNVRTGEVRNSIHDIQIFFVQKYEKHENEIKRCAVDGPELKAGDWQMSEWSS